MKALIKTYRLTLLVLSLLIFNQVANAQLCDITPNKFKGCKGDVFTFSIISPTSSYSSIMWNFGDGDSSNQMTSQINHKYTKVGKFIVTVTLRDGTGAIKCGPKTITIDVYDLPNADFKLPNPSTQCFRGNKFQFMDTSTAGISGAPIVSHAWDFGDGGVSTATNPLYSYLQSGAYTIFLQIADTNGCVDTATRISSIIVLPDLAPKFKTSYKISCPVTPVKFDNLSDSNGKCISTWWWDYGDGTGDSSGSNWNAQFTHTYKGDGAFNPKLVVKSCYGCTDSFIFPAGARNIFYWFDIKKSASGPVCWEGNNICFGQKPRPNAYYWLWTFDDPPSQMLNTDDKTWAPCHQYTSPGFFHITLKIWEPNCIRDTTFCSFIPLMGPQAMIKLPPPAKNSKCEAGKKIPIGVFESAYSRCLNPKNDPVPYSYFSRVAKYVSRTDSFYCNAPLGKVDSVLKPGCNDTIITKINYRLRYAQGATKYYDSVVWYNSAWYPGDPYPWVDDPIKYKTVYYPEVKGCNYKNMHDSDQYKFDCRGPNLVFFPNNSTKYRLRYDIDNEASKFSIPPGKDKSMDKCANPSYPWASDSMQHFWDFSDSYGDDCTSTVAVPNVKCKYSTQVAPLHLYSKTGCYSPKLTVTDTVTGCVSQSNVTIVMEPPNAAWDSFKVFKNMYLSGWDTSAHKLDWNMQLQMPPAWGRRGMILNGTPCVGQAYPQKPDFKETMPSCGRQKWWMVFDSAADCAGFCKDSFWVDTNGNVPPIVNKLIKVKAIQCSWIDDETFAMMGNKYIYSKGGCKTVGLIIKTGDCIDTFWYNQYKYIADLQARFDILDPASFDVDTGRYLSTLDYGIKQQYKLCPPFQAILTVKDTQQTGIVNFNFSISKNYSAPWTKAWNMPLEDSCIKVQSMSYMLCQKDSFFVSPVPPKDTTWTYCFMFPNPSMNCGVNQMGKVTVDDFLARGYLKKATYKLLDLRDTLFMNDSLGNSLFEPGKYAITTMVRNLYNCVNLAQMEVFVGHYTDFTATDQIICYEGGGDTVVFQGTARYFMLKDFPWQPDLDSTQFWRWPLASRGGAAPAAPAIPEVIEWDLNGDGVYGDGATSVPDSVFYVYTQPGNYTIRMKTTDSNNCTQVLERKNFIQVIGVVADFDTANGVSVCAPQTVQFIDKSYGLNVYQYLYDRFGNKIDSTAVDTVVSWKWNFGDSLGGNRSVSYLKNPIHTYRNNGCYTVSLIVAMENGCIDTIIKFKYVCIKGPEPDFIVLDSLGCQPFTVFVKDKSKNLSSWEFVKGDNTIGSFSSRPSDSIFALVYNTAGKYHLYLRASDSVFNNSVGKYITCTSEYAELSDSLDPHFTIDVKPVKMSNFDGDTLICSGNDAIFNDLSHKDYDTIRWNWDDGSALESLGRGKATHKYTLPAGIYDKSYNVAMDPSGADTICPDLTKYRTIRVVESKAGIAVPFVDLPKYQFVDRSAGGTHRKITIKGIDNPNYLIEYNSSDYKNDSLVDHSFMNDTGRFTVCEITWIERNGLIGCPDTSCIEVENKFVAYVIPPNIFTPGDKNGINDTFIIDNKGVEKWDLTIMNRWGEKVFKSANPKEHWNGKRNNTGAECAAGVYYYIINYQLRGKAEDSKSGSVTLVR